MTLAAYIATVSIERSDMRPPSRCSAALLLTGAALLLAAPPVAAQAVEWTARYNGGFVDADACPGSCLELTAKRSLAVDAAGNIYVTGYAKTPAEEFRTIKYSPTGQVIWSVGFDGSGQYTGHAVAIAVDAAGNAYVTGTIASYDSGDFLTVKYAAADGHVIWEHRYDGPEHDVDAAMAVGLDSAGNVFVTGYSNRLGGTELRTIKYAGGDGAQLWSVGYGAPDTTLIPYALAVDGAGNPIVTGSDGDYRTVKYSGSDGSVLWTRSYSSPGNTSDVARDVAVDGSGNVLVTGQSGAQGRAVKYAATDGAELWSVAFTGPAGGSADARAVVLDALGNAHVAGWSVGPNGPDYRVIKLAAGDGATLWDVTYDGPAHATDMAFAVTLDAAGNVLAFGRSDTATTPQQRTLKLAAADGSLVWTATAAGLTENGVFAVAAAPTGDVVVTSGYRDFQTIKYSGSSGAELFNVSDGVVSGIGDWGPESHGLAVDAGGNVVVVGTSYPLLSVMTAVKYSPSGGQLWATSQGAPSPGAATAAAVALDATGNVFVVGASNGNGTGEDFRTIKLSAADGSLLWGATHDGPAHDLDQARAVAVGAGGDAYVTGVERSGNDDWRTIRYAGSDGSVVWSVAFDSGYYDEPVALALDAAGNAYVLGRGDSIVSRRVTKYAAADGSVLWSQPFDGAGPKALAVDGAGNAYVVGSAWNGSNDDLRTTKYAAVDGAVLWTRDFDGAGGNDSPIGVALDGQGGVFVAGTSWNSSGTEVRALKYLALDGSPVWSAAVVGLDWGEGLTTGASGDLFVAGGRWNSRNYDFAAARLGAVDGHPLWSVSFDGANFSDDARVIAASGAAVYLAGRSPAPQTGIDFLTVKYVPDSVAPQSPTSTWSTTHAPGTWRNAAAIGMAWSGAVDPPPASGLLGYSVAFDASAGTVPDTTVEVPQSADPHGVTSAALPEGQSYYFHLRACDQGGNCSAAVHAGPYAIDTTPPLAPASVTSSSHVPGVPSNVTTLALQWTAAVDPLSNGVASGIDGYGWFLDDEAGAACSGQKVSEEWTTSVSVPVSLGTWYAHVCARDNAGNWSAVATAGPYLIGDPADLSVSLSDDADPIHVNGTVTYTATYANAGPSSAPGTTLVLTLPPGLSLVSSAPGEPVCSGDGQTVKCAMGDLSSSAGGTVTVTARALPRAKGPQSVSAKVRAEASDTDLSNNSAVQTTLVKFVKGDLQDDWATDLYLRNVTTGENVAWLMNGTTRLGEAAIEPAAPQYATQQVSGVDDFNGDGRNDLAFWDSATGAVEFWFMDGATRPGDPVSLTGGSQPPPWSLAATADFDRDGWPDLLWRNESTQKLVIWTLNGTARAGEIVPSPDQAVHANWQVVGAVDLNGDGAVDLLWYNVSTGKIVYWWMDAAVQRITGTFTNPPNAGDANWKVLATGDYGAGPGGIQDTADLVWRNETSGKYVVWHLDLAGNRTAGTFTTPDAPMNPLDWTVAGPR